MYDGFNAAVAAWLPESAAWEQAEAEGTRADPFWTPWSRSLRSACQVLSMEHIVEACEQNNVTVQIPEGAMAPWGHLVCAFLSRLASVNGIACCSTPE